MQIINVLVLAPFSFIKISSKIKRNKKIKFFFKYQDENKLNKNFINTIDALIPDPGANYKIDYNFINKFKKLRLIVTPSTGTNHIDMNLCKTRKIKVFCLLDDRKSLEKITASAEFTFTMILIGLRKLKKVFNGNLFEWRSVEDGYRGYELFNKKIGIVGYGRIGKKISKFCVPFGASCYFYDPFVKNFNKKICKKVSNLKILFRDCDVVVISPYLNKTSENLIDYPLLYLMKKNSLLVNTSRGEVVNETDLISFIKKRKDVFVNLDVIQGEQKNLKNNRLIKLSMQNNNLLITPHIAGLTYESQLKAGNFSINKIIDFFNLN